VPAGPFDPLTFTLVTGDGTIDMTGTADSCDNPDESTLSTSFSDGTTTVTVDVTGGSGGITVSGGTEFEGTVESAMVGDAGDVEITGFGSVADDSAGEPTGFAIGGSCAAPVAEPSEDGTFRLTTADGTLDLPGTPEACDNPGETTLAVEYPSGENTVSLQVDQGEGSVTVTGPQSFEGRVESIMVGDTGNVMVTGTGSPADDSAGEPTEFTLEGQC
jgi:hypothetical protein